MIKGIVAYLNYGHTHVYDNYYTKLYIFNHLIEQINLLPWEVISLYNIIILYKTKIYMLCIYIY